MPRTSTGLPDLDRDLRFLEALADESLRNLDTLADTADDAKSLQGAIPPTLIRLTAALGFDDTYAIVEGQCQASSRAALRSARDRLRRLAPSLLARPEVTELHIAISAGAGEPRAALPLRTISGISRLSLFTRRDEHFYPLIRFAFLDERQQPMLDSTGDWSDWLFLAGALVSNVTDELEKARSLQHSAQLRLPDPAALQHHFAALMRATQSLSGLAAEYGLVSTGAPSEQPTRIAAKGESR